MPSVNKILVVDDDKVSLTSTDHVLKSFGYHTVTASSGPEALQKLTHDIQMVLMDVMMPEMDGFEVTRRIRAHPELGNLPIIMVTGLTRMEDRLDALQAGANDFVSKPIDRVELAVRVASHLKLKEARDKGRASDARYRILVENSPLGTLCCNLGGEVTEMNAAASDLFGIPRGESWRLGNLLKNPNLTSPEAADFLMGCIESGKPAVGEFDIGPQGEKCIRFHVVPLYDEERGVSGLQIVCEDNSDRKRAEELQRRRTRLKAFAEMARVGEALLRRTGKDRGGCGKGTAFSRLPGLRRGKAFTRKYQRRDRAFVADGDPTGQVFPGIFQARTPLNGVRSTSPMRFAKPSRSLSRIGKAITGAGLGKYICNANSPKGVSWKANERT